jgi:hypothetical protein
MTHPFVLRLLIGAFVVSVVAVAIIVKEAKRKKEKA